MQSILKVLITTAVVLVSASATASNVATIAAHNQAVYAACTNKVNASYHAFLTSKPCAKMTACIYKQLKLYGDTRNIYIDAMVKCNNMACQRAIQKYDYSGRLLACLKKNSSH